MESMKDGMVAGNSFASISNFAAISSSHGPTQDLPKPDQKMCAEELAWKKRTEELRTAFDSFDLDGSGAISASEKDAIIARAIANAKKQMEESKKEAKAPQPAAILAAPVAKAAP